MKPNIKIFVKGMVIGLLGLATVVFAAPYYSFQRTILPESGTNDIGTSTKAFREVVAQFYTATSTTATSTFGGPVNVKTSFNVDAKSTNESATLGVELADSSGWTSTNWTGDFATGFTHTVGNTSPLSRSFGATGTNKYQVTFTVTGKTAGTEYTVSLGNSATYNMYIGDPATENQSAGITSVSDGDLVFTPDSDFDGKISNISVKQITGTYSPTVTFKDSAGSPYIEVRSTTNGLQNQYLGFYAGQYNTSGYQNVINGNYSFINNTSGFWNSVLGTSALTANTTGSRNSAVGYAALAANISGLRNACVGTFCINKNTTGNQNVALGSDTLFTNTTGSSNAAIGFASLYSNISGSYNYGFGESSLNQLTTGSNNIGIGYRAGINIVSGSNNIIIGHNSTATSSTSVNGISIGDTIWGNSGTKVVGIGVATPLAPLDVLNSDATASGLQTVLKLEANSVATAGNGACIKFSASAAAGYGSDLCSVRRDGALSDFLIKTGGYATPVERMRITDAGKTGFGTTTPNNLVDIYSTTKAAIGFSGASGDTNKWTMGYDVTNGKFAIASSTALGTLNRFVIDGNGNVGIGSSNPSSPLFITASSSVAMVSIINTATSLGATFGGLSITGDTAATTITSFQNSGTGITIRNANATAGVYNGIYFQDAGYNGVSGIIGYNIDDATNQGALGFVTRPSGGGVTERMRITPSGNIGIGTTTPDSSLLLIGTSSPLLSVSSSNGFVGIGTAVPTKLFTVIGSGGNERFSVTYTGGVNAPSLTTTSISATSIAGSSGSLLTISGGGTQVGSQILLTSNTYATDPRAIIFKIGDTTTTEVMRIASSTNVGIGTSTPQWPLTIASSTGGQLSLSAGSGLPQVVMRNTGSAFYIATTTLAGTATSTPFAFKIDLANGMTSFRVPRISMSSTQDQSCTLAENPITLDTNDINSEGITHSTSVNNATSTIAYAGVYEIVFSAIGYPGSPDDSMDIWLVVNNAAVANSNTHVVLPNSSDSVIAASLMYNFTAGDTMQLRMKSNNAATKIDANAASSPAPASPSIIVTIKRISGE